MGNVIYYIKKVLISCFIGFFVSIIAMMIGVFPEQSPLYALLMLGIIFTLLIWGQKFLPFIRKASDRKAAEVSSANAPSPQYKKYALYTFFAICFVAGIMVAAKRHETSTAINTSSNYSLNEKQHIVLNAMIQDDLEGAIRGTPSLLSLSDLGVTASISAVSLARAYEANEVAADNQYKGKMILVRGAIDDISKDFVDNHILRLNANNLIFHVSAYMAESEQNELADMHKGETITLVCRGDGYTVGSPILRECKLTINYLIEQANQQFNRFLNGDDPSNKKMASILYGSLVTAELLPETSPCSNNGNFRACRANIKAVLKGIKGDPTQEEQKNALIKGFQEAGIVSEELARNMLRKVDE